MFPVAAGGAVVRRLSLSVVVTLFLLCSQPAISQTPTSKPNESRSTRTFRGVLVDPAGLPVSHAEVTVAGGDIWGGVQSDIQGRFELANIPQDAKTILAFSQRSCRMAVIPIRGEAKPDTRYVLNCDEITVVGRVADRDAKAVQGAEATFHVTGPENVAYAVKSYGKTQADGYILLGQLPAVPGWTIRASLPTGESTPAVPMTGLLTVVLPDLVQRAAAGPSAKTLAPLALYSGRIVDAERKPIPGVTVQIMNKQGPRMQFRAATDQNGRWSLRLPADSESLDLRLDHPDFVGFEFDLQQPSPPAHALRDGSGVQVMMRGLRLKGRVRDPSGRPLGNALVLAGVYTGQTADGEPLEDSTAARTADDGTFSIGGIPEGPRSLLVLAEGFAPTSASVSMLPQMKSVEIQVDRGRMVRGRVVDEKGKPLANVTIKTDSWQLPGVQRHSVPRTVRSGAEGRFVLPALPSQGSVAAIAYGKGRLGVRFAIESASDEVGEITLYRYPVIEAKVVDAQSGAPIHKFGVTDEFVYAGEKMSALHLEAPVEAKDGVFRREIKHVILGREKSTQFLTRITAPGYLIALSPPVEPGKEYKPFLIKLTRASSLSGRIVTPGDKGASRAQVFFVGAENDAWVTGTMLNDMLMYTPDVRTVAEADGQFALAWPGQEGRVLFLHDAGYAVVPTDQLKRDHAVKLTAWARMEGTYRPEGIPRVGVRVRAEQFRPKADLQSRDRLQFQLATTTDTDGRFIIEHVPVGELQVAAWVGFGPAVAKTVRFKAGRTAHVVLADDGPMVNGRVELRPVIAANPPPPGVKFDTSTSWVRAVRIEPRPEAPSGVDAADWKKQLESVLQGRARENLTIPARFANLKPDGSFQFEALAPGRYIVLVDIHGQRPPETCGWGVLLANGRADFTVGSQPLTLAPIELKATIHPQVGRFAPSVAWKTTTGEEITLSSLRGKYVVLDFWAGWCAPCLASQPALKAVHERYKNRATFVGLNFDYTDAKANEAINLLKSPWPQVLAGPWDADNRTLVTYGVEVIPSIWLIDEEGRIVAKDLTPDRLEKALASLSAR
jgi:thiol-disulfide isomerase/thioredoxin